MESKVFSYDSDEIEVTWDQKRCIHAKECVHGLPDVFDISRKPWIDPDQKESTDELINVIKKCPSGALQYHLKQGGTEETPPSANTVQIVENGPIYIHGDIAVVDMDGEVLMNETRLAFCRCGGSANKPLCDNNHLENGFSSSPVYNPERLETEPSTKDGGQLTVKLVPDGPFVIEGQYEVHGSDKVTKTQKRMSFCRCGGSSNKPFCDGSHRKIEFKSS